jgi:small subunit ribosomal protein S3Ae
MIKKEWYSVLMPKAFGEEVIGEVLTQDPKQLINRRIEVSMNDVNRDLSKFYIKLAFRVDSVDKDSAHTSFDGHRCMREYISHIVRPKVTRVDSNALVTTKDGKKLRVKGILLFSKNVNRSLKSAAIDAMNKTVMEFAEKQDFDDFVKSMVFGEMPSEIRKRCNKIYPVSKVEIRKSEVLPQA